MCIRVRARQFDGFRRRDGNAGRQDRAGRGTRLHRCAGYRVLCRLRRRDDGSCGRARFGGSGRGGRHQEAGRAAFTVRRPGRPLRLPAAMGFAMAGPPVRCGAGIVSGGCPRGCGVASCFPLGGCLATTLRTGLVILHKFGRPEEVLERGGREARRSDERSVIRHETWTWSAGCRMTPSANPTCCKAESRDSGRCPPDASGGAGLRGRAGCRRGLPDDGGGAASGVTVTVRWEVERGHARASGSGARGLYMSRRSGGGVAGALPMPCLQRAGGKKDARLQAGGAGSVQEPASIAGACRIACRAAVPDDASPQSGVCEAGRPAVGGMDSRSRWGGRMGRASGPRASWSLGGPGLRASPFTTGSEAGSHGLLCRGACMSGPACRSCPSFGASPVRRLPCPLPTSAPR